MVQDNERSRGGAMQALIKQATNEAESGASGTNFDQELLSQSSTGFMRS